MGKVRIVVVSWCDCGFVRHLSCCGGDSLAVETEQFLGGDLATDNPPLILNAPNQVKNI